MIFELPDGIIEFRPHCPCHPPGSQKGGQHVNSMATWMRINSGEWKICEIPNIARRAAFRCESVEEFKAVIEQETK